MLLGLCSRSCFMPDLTLSDRLVVRVLLCLRGYRKKSLTEITGEYNRYYPPGIIKKTIGIHVEEHSIKPVLEFLIKNELVRAELLSFTNKPLLYPEKFYTLTHAGVQFLNRKQ